MRILVVEDEHKIASSIKKGLEQENFVVDVAFDGDSGYGLGLEEEYDVIVLDLMLPGMDGMTICKKLRENGKQTPILMLTAKGQLMDKVEGLNSGADDYLVKPFAFDELLARIKAISRRPKVTITQKLKVNDLELDTTTFEVKKSGKSVLLSKKEFGLLEYLMRNKGRIVSKDELISRIWNYEADILPNTVEVFVKYLRNKLGKNTIQTVRGFGYKINV